MSVSLIVLMLVILFKMNVDVYDVFVFVFFFLLIICNYEMVFCNVFWYELVYVDYCDLIFGWVLGNFLIVGLVLIGLMLMIGCMVVYVLVWF